MNPYGDAATRLGVVEDARYEIETGSSDEFDELLTDLLCHIYGTLESQNG